MRRAAGVRWAPVKSFIADALPALVTVVLVGLIIFYLRMSSREQR